MPAPPAGCACCQSCLVLGRNPPLFRTPPRADSSVWFPAVRTAEQYQQQQQQGILVCGNVRCLGHGNGCRVCFSTAQHSTAQHSTAQHSTADSGSSGRHCLQPGCWARCFGTSPRHGTWPPQCKPHPWRRMPSTQQVVTSLWFDYPAGRILFILLVYSAQ
jgi:hypothetical protein